VPINLEGGMTMATFTFSKKFGVLLLGIWLIAMGLQQAGVIGLTHPINVILGILAVIAGIIIIIDR